MIDNAMTSPSALLYISSYAVKWPKPEFVQQAVALLSLGKKPA